MTDVDDLRAHVRYVGGYHGGHRTIRLLWEVLREFTPQEQSLFLKFVTSCSKVRRTQFGKSLSAAQGLLASTLEQASFSFDSSQPSSHTCNTIQHTRTHT